MSIQKLAFLIVLTFISIFSFAQNNGVLIVKNLSWLEIKDKARSEHKYILIDCNSSWCGPCKYLENILFPMDTIGKLLNPKFIVVSVQFDTTDSDNAFTKSWYKTAQYFKNQYNVTAFPTEIILDENAQPLTKFIGINTEDGVNDFYTKITNSLDPNHQYYSLKKSYDLNKSLPVFQQKNLVLASNIAGEMDDFKFYYQKYLNSLDSVQFYSPDNCHFLVKNLHSTQDPLFTKILSNYAKIDSIVGTPIARDRLSGIIFSDKIFWKIFKGAGSISENHYVYVEEPNWDNLKMSLEDKYSNLNSDILFYTKMQYYFYERKYDEYFATLKIRINSSLPIFKQFSEDAIVTICNRIYKIKGKDPFWLNTGLKWLNNFSLFSNTRQIEQSKSMLQSKLSKITN